MPTDDLMITLSSEPVLLGDDLFITLLDDDAPTMTLDLIDPIDISDLEPCLPSIEVYVDGFGQPFRLGLPQNATRYMIREEVNTLLTHGLHVEDVQDGVMTLDVYPPHRLRHIQVRSAA